MPIGGAQIVRIQEHLSAPARGRVSSLELLFEQLVLEWRQGTENLSALDEIVLHPSYQRIIGLGERTLPLILRAFAERVDHWDWALRAITGAAPVSEEDEGDLFRMRDAWLAWGREAGMLLPDPK
jgi:hypothetical protein